MPHLPTSCNRLCSPTSGISQPLAAAAAAVPQLPAQMESLSLQLGGKFGGLQLKASPSPPQHGVECLIPGGYLWFPAVCSALKSCTLRSSKGFWASCSLLPLYLVPGEQHHHHHHHHYYHYHHPRASGSLSEISFQLLLTQNLVPGELRKEGRKRKKGLGRLWVLNEPLPAGYSELFYLIHTHVYISKGCQLLQNSTFQQLWGRSQRCHRSSAGSLSSGMADFRGEKPLPTANAAKKEENRQGNQIFSTEM